MASESGELQSGLKRRHVTMISLGGVIGAGLFVGSGAVINQTGPAAVLSYLAAGGPAGVAMRMLPVVVMSRPCTGAFRCYPGSAFRGLARFSGGGLDLYFCVFILAVEFAA